MAIYANDNRPPQWPLKILYEKGELGRNEQENRSHWQAAVRFQRDHAIAWGDSIEESAISDWRYLTPDYMELDQHTELQPHDFTDKGLRLDSNREFQDTATFHGNYSVNNWNPYRDHSSVEDSIRSKQILAHAHQVLGPHFPIICAATARNYTTRMIGETEGYRDPAAAAACGKGMLRCSLRMLVLFYKALDDLEAGVKPPERLWKLVGTPKWTTYERPAGWETPPYPTAVAA
jgi:hypothetical protein